MSIVNRTRVNQSEVSASNPIKSGFNLSYTSYNDYMLGRAHVSGYHYVMPGTKFSGHNKGDFMFNYVHTQFVAPIDATQFNVAVSLRSIDNSFEDAFAPGKNNDMSNVWRTPTFTLKDKALEILKALNICQSDGTWVSAFSDIFDYVVTDSTTLVSSIPSYVAFLSALEQITANTATKTLFEQHYLSDALSDYLDYVQTTLAGINASTPVLEARYTLLYAILGPLLGERSLMDELGYIILRNEDIHLLFYGNADYGQISGTSGFGDANALVGFLDATPQCEYALRAYYAMWYQLLRDPNLEPVASTLPKWKQFGSASVITIPFLFHRLRSWYNDLFTDAQPDDMMRHVYAPIFQKSVLGDKDGDIDSAYVYYPQDSHDYYNAEANAADYLNQHNIVAQTLTWRNPLTGVQMIMECPLPGLVNDSLRGDIASHESYGLDLFNLRQAQSLERYLKRNFYFGDEYKDRMLAHYGSEVSDYRLNYPTLLSTSINAANQDRLVNNTPTSESVAGERNVNLTIQSSGDGYESFAEEFTIVLNLISFMPRPQYSGVSGFNLLYRQMDFPLPEFAANNEELSRVVEISASGLAKDLNSDEIAKYTFGHHPYAHIWRSRVDEAHGTFRSSRSACLFTRYFSSEDGDPTTFPKLNYWFIHCRPNLAMFNNTVRLDGQLSGSVSHDFYAESPLPVPVEEI